MLFSAEILNQFDELGTIEPGKLKAGAFLRRPPFHLSLPVFLECGCQPGEEIGAT
jgi:hypothetical protein